MEDSPLGEVSRTNVSVSSALAAPSAPRERTGVPFWRSNLALAMIGCFATLAPALTTGVSAHFQKEREVQLEERKQLNVMRKEYLAMALDPQRTAGERREVLRFLADAMEGDPIQRWAQHELQRVSEEVTSLAREAEQQKHVAMETFQNEKKLRLELEANNDKRPADAETIQAVKRKIAALQAQREAAVDEAIRAHNAANPKSRVARKEACESDDALCGAAL